MVVSYDPQIFIEQSPHYPQFRNKRSSLFDVNKAKNEPLSEPTARNEKKISASSPFEWLRRRSSGPIITALSSHRPVQSSLNSVQDASSTPIEQGADPLGLQVVHEPKTKSIADVVFIHGLGGSSHKTWSKCHNPNFFWPGLWLPDDPIIGKARLLTYGYNSQIFGGPRSVSRIDTFATNLLYDMHNSWTNNGGKLEMGRVPIIFVAHSMGGLVAKKAYLLSQNDEEFNEIFRAISGILFLATPHQGSNLAHSLSLILKALLQPEKMFITDLETNSRQLNDLNRSFRNLAPRLSIVSFYEEHHTTIAKRDFLIVGEDSAVLGLPKEQVRGLPADHHDVCKFNDRDDPKYRIFANRCIFNHPWREVQQHLAISRTPIEDFNTLFDRKVPGSCEWIREEPCIKTWLEGYSEPHVVWYTAPPASGKSVLSSYLIHYLQSEGYQCQYYFFDFGDQSKRSVENMIRSLAYQISCSMPKYGKKLLEVLRQGPPLDKSDAGLAWQKLFKDPLLRNELDRTLFWVIDGLDESEAPKKVVDILRELLQSEQMKLKVLFTSRRTEALNLGFQKLMRNVRVDLVHGEDHNYNLRDIRLYVEAELDYLPGSAKLKQRLKDDILERARGNFLWVTLVLEELHNCHTENAIYEMLDQIPEDMGKMYQRMELQITESATQSNVALAKLLLQWTMCAPRPLTLKELTQALEPDYSDFRDLETMIRSVCGQFILIDSTEHVTIIHHTAREYLTNASQSSIAIHRQRAHSTLLVKTLANLCNTSLKSKVFLQSRQELEAKRPFLLYAATSWISHLRYADPISDEVLEKLAHFFKQHCVLDWIYILALLKQLCILVQAARALTKFVSKNRKLNATRSPMLHRLSTLELLESWTVDLVRIAGKFSRHLLVQPQAIYEIVPALCPSNSITNLQFHRNKTASMRIYGQNESWNDVFARFSLRHGEPAWKVVCAGQYLAALTQVGTIYIWRAIDFEEICALRHLEPVTDICMNSKGDRVVSYGLKSTILWELPTGKILLQTLNPKTSRAMSLTFADSDTVILAASDDRIIRVLQTTESEVAWEPLDANLLREKTQTASAFINTPKCMVLKPDGKQVGVSYRSFPLSVWDLDSSRLIARCKRANNPFNLGSDTAKDWFAVDLFTWNPITGHIIGLYKDKTIFKWHPVSNENREVSTSVDEVACSPDGKLFVTSDSEGTVKVWNFASFSVIYQLSSGDPVSGLCFSPDCARFYDVRSSVVTAWEPNGLIRLAESEEPSSDATGDDQPGTLTSHISEAIAPQHPMLMVLAAAPTGLQYVTGNEDGEVCLSDGKSTCKTEITKFHNFQSVTHLVWAQNGNLVAAADLGADIHITQICTPGQDDAYSGPALSLPSPKLKLEGRAIHQMLVDPLSCQLLVISDDLAQVWSITDGAVKTSVNMYQAAQRGWINHPTNSEMFLGIGTQDIQVYHWVDLQQVHQFRISNEAFSLARQPTFNIREEDSSSELRRIKRASWRQEGPAGKVYRSMLTQDCRHIIAHIKEYLVSGKVQKRLLVVETSALEFTENGTEPHSIHYLRIPPQVAEKIEFPLGILPGSKLVFFDRDLWVCSMVLNSRASLDSFKRHYFIPRDWTSVESIEQCSLLRDGTLICPRDGDVIIVRSNFDDIDH
ncbi:uncharacterized protein Z518_04206 [Rhinocladiella mackenziei CBS 650.93]|uniref:GPI inositol-deacylase n=1 Tax=Rhinocladiella mackenziei CBS 650.93 TaxID=1442369 RepID=A0A0D2ISS4_9EURO|nr:uncharacterized protein Z518_04206 [Rhinocladiella mackenziei CBS 650.93]KIX06231.1 hypothetical protein Z518_04206 [Rhinocladiella mackenziei CBS 650.93]